MEGLFAYVAGKLLSLRSLLCAVFAESVDNEVIINAMGFLMSFFKLNIYTVVQKSKKVQHAIKLGAADIFFVSFQPREKECDGCGWIQSIL
jgi:ferredoxin-fold anticodon binding domain-containing protein